MYGRLFTVHLRFSGLNRLSLKEDFVEKNNTSRRRFLSAATAGMSTGAVSPFEAGAAGREAGRSAGEPRLPREVWIATLTQERLEADTADGMIGQIFERMSGFESYRPDIVCLPEVFPYAAMNPRPSLDECAETPPGPVTKIFAEYALGHKCYVVCPTYTRFGGKFYNSSVLIGRNGEIVGVYHKIHLTRGEIERGLTPGPLEPPVMETDFGKVGFQICYDIEWDDGWRKLSQAGAEIVVWSSAFAGGRRVNSLASRNRYCIVSSVRKDTAKICDVTEEEVATTGRWNRWVCAPVNLEKVFLHTWPHIRRFGEILEEYGRDVHITNFHEEEWSIIESRSPDVRVADIMKKYELETMNEHLHAAEIAQNRARP